MNMAIFFEKTQPKLEKFLTRLSSKSEDLLETFPLHRKLLYLNDLTCFKILNSSLRMHILYILDLLKKDLRDKKILNENNKSFFTAKRNMEEIETLEQIEAQDAHLTTGESSLKIQIIVKLILQIFRHIERVDNELFDFAYSFFYDNVGYFERKIFSLSFKAYSYILYQTYIELDRQGGRGRYRNLRSFISESEDRLYKSRNREIRKKNLELLEKIFPIVLGNMKTMCYWDLKEFLFSLTRFRFNFRHLFPYLKDIYLEAFEKYKAEIILIKEITENEKIKKKDTHVVNLDQVLVPADFQHSNFFYFY